MDVVKLKTGERGIVIIPQKQKDLINGHIVYTLNLVLTENDHYVELPADDFKKIGEIEDD